MRYASIVLLIAVLAAAPQKVERPPKWPGIQALYGPAFAAPIVPPSRAGIEAKTGGIFPDFFCLIYPERCKNPKPHQPK